MIETVLRESASDIPMQEMLEMYEDAISPVLNVRYLLSAMLERALLDLKENVARSNYEWFTDALIWFEGSSPVSGAFTYQQVISTLDFTANDVKLIESKIEEGRELHRYILERSRAENRACVKSPKYLHKIINEKRTVGGN